MWLDPGRSPVPSIRTPGMLVDTGAAAGSADMPPLALLGSERTEHGPAATEFCIRPSISEGEMDDSKDRGAVYQGTAMAVMAEASTVPLTAAEGIDVSFGISASGETMPSHGPASAGFWSDHSCLSQLDP